MARIMTIPPNVKYIEDFSKTQENARNQNKGFWKDFDQWE
jgi:micrococcal nuclease